MIFLPNEATETRDLTFGTKSATSVNGKKGDSSDAKSPKITVKGLQVKIRPCKIISVFLVMGLKILGRVDTHIFSSRNKYNFMHFERHFAFQNAQNYIFSRKPEQFRGFTSKFR